jgi:hypothetical protein
MARLESLLQRISQCHIVGLDFLFFRYLGAVLISRVSTSHQKYSPDESSPLLPFSFSAFQLSRPRLPLLHLLINLPFHLPRLL